MVPFAPLFTLSTDQVLDRIVSVAQDRPSVLLAAALALLAVLWSTVWRWARTVVTIAHEGGHAVVAVLAGRGLTGIRLHPDTSGLTVSTGAPSGPGLVLTFLGGYPMPPILGFAGALLVANDHAEVMLWIGVGALVLTLVWVRNVYGALAVLVTGALLGVVAYFGTPRLRDGFAAALCWFLVFGGLRAVRELQRGRLGRSSRHPHGRGGSDADMLAALTRVPRGAWVGVFWLLGTAALVGTAWALLL